MLSLLLSIVFVAATVVNAETHTVTFTNNCGFGTPMLIQGSDVLSTGADFTINGPLEAAIAYLQTGGCGFNGENCTVLETTLKNPTTPGSGSNTTISDSPPNAFSVAVGFCYFNGCDGTGIGCPGDLPILQPGESQESVPCEANNVNLAITFCD